MMIKLCELYGSDYLICDGSNPLITDSLAEEMLLYHIDVQFQWQVLNLYNQLCARNLCHSANISALSGGQKILLMIVLALHSRAKKLLLINVFEHLDADKKKSLKAYLDSQTIKTIRYIDDSAKSF